MVERLHRLSVFIMHKNEEGRYIELDMYIDCCLQFHSTSVFVLVWNVIVVNV